LNSSTCAARLHNSVAHPAHAARVLDAIHVTEAEIAREIGSHGIGVEHYCVEQRRQGIGKHRLAGARQTHDKDFTHFVGSATPNADAGYYGLWRSDS
jgi:hypothetical protein